MLCQDITMNDIIQAHIVIQPEFLARDYRVIQHNSARLDVCLKPKRTHDCPWNSFSWYKCQMKENKQFGLRNIIMYSPIKSHIIYYDNGYINGIIIYGYVDIYNYMVHISYLKYNVRPPSYKLV